MSLVHPKGRVDVPVSSLGEVKAAATYRFRNSETGQVHEYPNPHVSVCFAEDIQKRICELTRQLVGQPMEIVIDCATISKPIVREPLCAHPCFQVSANDIAEATALAQRIRRGSNRTCAPSS
jgi:preprotein translocase subunit SecD